MKRILLLGFLICATAAWGDETPKLEVKRRSSFEVDQPERNPFWPIGWKPAPRIANADHAGPAIPASAFVVSSIVLDPHAHMAIINGRPMSEGQLFGMKIGNQIHQISVKAIEDGRVVLAQHDQEIIVPLRRK